MAHELNFLFVNIVNGLVYGSFLLLTSLGLSLVFGLGRVVNFAHGAFYALGGYVLISVMRVGAGFWLALAVVPVVLTGIGLALEAGLIRRLRKRPEVDTLLATFGLSAMLVGGIEYLWGTSTTIVKPPLGFEGIVQVLSNDFPIYRFAAAGLSLLMAAGVLAIVQWTPLGLRIRAIADEVDRSRLLWQVFGYAAGLAGFAGALGAPIFAVHPEMGLSILIDSFLVVVLGGLGSLKGSTIGAAVVSVTKAVGGAYLADWSTALLFLIVASVLVARPTGIFATGRIA